MNAFGSLLPLCSGLLLLLATVGVWAGSVQNDLVELAATESPVPFDEDKVGYDKHSDVFYYKDDSVDKENSRGNFRATRVTLAGQKRDAFDRAVDKAVNPFGVAQRTFKFPLLAGTFMDRWDVKDTGKDVQYFALYHGRGNTFVVNKLRAHLLRILANALNDQLPSLDRNKEPDADDQSEAARKIREEVLGTIERVFREVDRDIRNSMYLSDDSSSTATIAIVTKNYVITAGVGTGKVIAYDSGFNTNVLTPTVKNEETNVFGMRRARSEYIQPYVEFHSREDLSFLLIETPSVATNLDDDAATKRVADNIVKLRGEENQEQDIYSRSLMEIMKLIEESTEQKELKVFHTDYSIILVGVSTDYEAIY